MSDEPFAPEPTRGAGTRSPYLIGGLAFAGGIAVTAAAFQLAGGIGAPQPDPGPRIEAPQPQANPAAALPPGTDIATLGAREQELAGKLDQLELRLRDISGSARNASSYASRAEQLLIAAAVRRAIERGQPLGPLEAQLRQRFAETRGEAVGMILRASAEPVTLGDLRLALETIAPRLASGADDSMWMSVRRLLSDLVVLRQTESPSPRTADRLRRARLALDHGDVEAALAEIVHLPGVASAQSWIVAARRYIAARQGLLDIERAALEAPAVPSAAGPARPAAS
ncbi:hypothetical protein [Sphingomonas psychrotolerans]|uniref:Inner membrane protein n=1 Tax=Sphingomonas psychrotolerans TaxID=1327635 RepID=A0A2K8MH21_9SPHN|nr:hypothetical protein [Sphingomonas psychrotolerans]ATY33180.1 hypothetical protein CVN68_15395 [Sphingomonas psychrotolerans]